MTFQAQRKIYRAEKFGRLPYGRIHRYQGEIYPFVGESHFLRESF